MLHAAILRLFPSSPHSPFCPALFLVELTWLRGKRAAPDLQVRSSEISVPTRLWCPPTSPTYLRTRRDTGSASVSVDAMPGEPVQPEEAPTFLSQLHMLALMLPWHTARHVSGLLGTGGNMYLRRAVYIPSSIAPNVASYPNLFGIQTLRLPEWVFCLPFIMRFFS